MVIVQTNSRETNHRYKCLLELRNEMDEDEYIRLLFHASNEEFDQLMADHGIKRRRKG